MFLTTTVTTFKFFSTGTYITKFGSAGSGDGQFNAPYGITFDKNNDIYVADSRNHRVQKFASSTSLPFKIRISRVR